MPQVFGDSHVSLMNMAAFLAQSAAAEDRIEKLTHPQVAAVARERGLVPLRMGLDPIWHHPATGKAFSLAPLHSGDSGAIRRIKNDIAHIRRSFPTEEELAKASRTPEEVEADQAAAAGETRTKKQQRIDADRRRREQQAQKEFKELHAPFRSQAEIQDAFNRRSEKAMTVRPDDTVEQFAERLRDLPLGARQQVHRAVFPERYKQP